MNIGLIGAGAIAKYLLQEINAKEHKKLKVTSVLVRNEEKYQELEGKYDVQLYTELDEFLTSKIDIVVEAAGVKAVEQLLPEVVKKKDSIVISVGALVDEALLGEIQQLAEEHQRTVHLPSGAIGGLDLLQNANVKSIKRVTLTTRKPAHSLIEERITEEKTIFEGKAKDAIKLFPKNINVSIVLSLAGLGIDDTTVRLIADPHIEKNIHQIDIEGEFGEASISVKNNPLPSNPKTSYLAAMSILGTLERLNQKVRIGG